MKTYTPQIVCEVLGIEPVTLRSWHNQGTTMLHDGSGSRPTEIGLHSEGPVTGEGEAKRRSYTFFDALAIGVMARLVKGGVSRRHAAEIINEKRKHFDMPTAWLWVALDPNQMPTYALQNSPVNVEQIRTEYPETAKDAMVIIIVLIHEIAEHLRRKLTE